MPTCFFSINSNTRNISTQLYSTCCLCCAVLCCADRRRLTPNFKIRAEVGFNTRCSFPLTLKVYVITQQEKDSVPEWVPDDFLDPDLPQVGFSDALRCVGSFGQGAA